jgi:hypothetical protein
MQRLMDGEVMDGSFTTRHGSRNKEDSFNDSTELKLNLPVGKPAVLLSLFLVQHERFPKEEFCNKIASRFCVGLYKRYQLCERKASST